MRTTLHLVPRRTGEPAPEGLSFQGSDPRIGKPLCSRVLFCFVISFEGDGLEVGPSGECRE